MRRVTAYKEYATREGDTFDALALEMYGDETLAHYIIDFKHQTGPPFWREYTRGRTCSKHTTRQQARNGTAATWWPSPPIWRKT